MHNDDVEPPFRAAYVESDDYTITCTACGEAIRKNDLRLANMIDTPLTNLTGFREPEWYHFSCFFTRMQATSVTDFSGFYRLRADDQEKIQKIVDQSRTKLSVQGSINNSPSSSSTSLYPSSTTGSTTSTFLPASINGTANGFVNNAPVSNIPLAHTGYAAIPSMSTSALTAAVPGLGYTNSYNSILSASNVIYYPLVTTSTSSSVYGSMISSAAGISCLQSTSASTFQPNNTFVPLTNATSSQFSQNAISTSYIRPTPTRYSNNIVTAFPPPEAVLRRPPLLLPVLQRTILSPGVQNITSAGVSKFSSLPNMSSKAPKRPCLASQNASNWPISEPPTFTFRENDTRSTTRLLVKDGAAVDSQSMNALKTQVYRDWNGNIYSAVLLRTDWYAETNSFHKLQVLETVSSRPEYWLFQTKGELGAVGYMYDERLMSKAKAVTEFERTFTEETGNLWHERNSFKKIQGKKLLVDIVYEANVIFDGSQLVGPVQNFIRLIHPFGFTKREKETLDLEKWPLGIVSDKQIQTAYEMLSNLEDYAKKQEKTDDDLKKIIRITNEYYSSIPCNFGSDKPLLLNNLPAIQKENEKLDSLMTTQTRYSLIDAYYERLNSKLRPLGAEEVLYEVVKTCVLNTCYGKVEILEIFEVERLGEDLRYTCFKNLTNRKMLWHGSRLKHFSKILAQGLCIAPSGVQISGHNFGRGIYFSDMVAKASHYCRADTMNNHVGLLLLCEVALGNMQTVTEIGGELMLPLDDFDSVKAIGHFQPDPHMNMTLEDGVEIALGRAVHRNIKTSCLFNEFVVFDEAQVKIRYLIQAKLDPSRFDPLKFAP